jgi:hypothetical protein
MKLSKRQLCIKIEKIKLDLQAERKKNRKLIQRNKELEKSRNHQQSKVRQLRHIMKAHSKAGHGEIVSINEDTSKLIGHKYSLSIVSLCVSLYAFGGCSFRGVRRVLVYLCLEMGIKGTQIPSKSSIENWVQKVGYYEYSHSCEDIWSSYCLIVDESMVIGSQRMVVVLAAPSDKESNPDKGSEGGSLSLSCVRLVGIGVRASWCAQDVQEMLEKVQEKIGYKALYVMSDGGSNICKGIRDSGSVHVNDVGHAMGRYLEQTYKEHELFKAWSTAVAQVKFREVMKPSAYLLPPKQRSIARFINMSNIVRWSEKMIRILPQLNALEQKTFAFLNTHKAIIEELEQVFNMTESIMKLLKNEGLSVENGEKAKSICQKETLKVPKSLKEKIIRYLDEQVAKLPDEKTVWHVSSDVIESLFGKYKQKNATNTLNGVTPLVLSLAVYTNLGEFESDNLQLKERIKLAMESVFMNNLTQWKQGQLIENQIVKRTKLFKK